MLDSAGPATEHPALLTERARAYPFVPVGPYAVTVTLAATCNPGPGGGGTMAFPVSLGFDQLTVPVTVGAGPQRRCTITGTATITLADGMTLTAAGDSTICLVDPAPGSPGTPRLDMQLLDSPGDDLNRVHPGDQATHTLRITNNDPADSFSGQLNVQMVNSSRLPGSTGPMPPGTGPFSVSDPVEGDNFPIAFEEDLFEGCVLLPPDPTDPAVPSLSRDVDLDPLESIDIDIFSRPWGMCANGS